MAERDGESNILIEIYEEQGATLHRLVVLLGAESASGHIIRTALLALGRRINHVVDPLERLEYLEEQVVHLARGVREPDGFLHLPLVEDRHQSDLLIALGKLPPRVGEALVVSHYLAVFGPELARILRMTIHATNRRLESGLEQLRQLVPHGAAEAEPELVDSLSGELTAALRASARHIQPAGTETLAAELRTLGDLTRHGVSGWVAALLFSLSLFLGGWLAMLSSPAGGAAPVPVVSATHPSTEPESAPPSPQPQASHSLPAQARSVPVYYVGRRSGLLYRELRDLPAGGDLVRSALDAVLTLAPLDPDYDTAWGPGKLLGTVQEGDLLTVDLSRAAFEGIASSEHAQIAALQMVYTASKLAGNPALRLAFLMEGQAPPTVFAEPQGFGTSGLAPMAPLWVTWPKNGAALGPGQAVIVGSVKPDATPPAVTVKSEAGVTLASVVAQTAISPGSDGWRSWSVAVQFGPGAYLITASTEYTDSTGRTRVFEDTKSITVS